MIFVVLGLGGVFFGLGYLITEGNASLLLSGYNTMNSEDQKSFPLKEYLREFKRFHQLFGLGFTSLGDNDGKKGFCEQMQHEQPLPLMQ